MGQVIEVRFINPTTKEVLADQFTATSSSNYRANSHEPMHREAIELALDAWSAGTGVLKGIERQGDVEPANVGATSSWRYIYICVLEDPDDGIDKEVFAVLFAQYKEPSVQ